MKVTLYTVPSGVAGFVLEILEVRGSRAKADVVRWILEYVFQNTVKG
jgi:hypothetical protein